MKITFGLRLDGEHGWRPADRLGMPVFGPLGLLNLLETRLGLLRAECTQAQRVTQYRECLKSCDTPEEVGTNNLSDWLYITEESDCLEVFQNNVTIVFHAPSEIQRIPYRRRGHSRDSVKQQLETPKQIWCMTRSELER